MRDLQANHLAIVAKGRSGSDVVVGDGMIMTNSMRDYLAMFPHWKRLKR